MTGSLIVASVLRFQLERSTESPLFQLFQQKEKKVYFFSIFGFLKHETSALFTSKQWLLESIITFLFFTLKMSTIRQATVSYTLYAEECHSLLFFSLLG